MSTAPITLVSFPKSADASYDKIVSSLIAKGEIVSVAHGHRIENPNQVEFLIQWAPSTTPSLPSELSDVCSGNATVHHVEFKNKEAALKALKAPVTELLTFTLKPGKDMTAFEELLKKGNELHVGAPGYHDSDLGFDGDKAVIILGWDSKEDHDKYAATGVIKPVFAQWLEFVDMKDTVVCHIPFKHAE